MRRGGGTAVPGVRREGVLPTSEQIRDVDCTPVGVRKPRPRARVEYGGRATTPGAAIAASWARVVGGVVTHFLWVSRTTARFRCRLEPGVRAPAPLAGPAPPAPRPPPARRAPSLARGARGARSGARWSAEPGWRPRTPPRARPPPARRLPRATCQRSPALRTLSLPPLRPVPPGLPGPRRPPRRPRSYGQTHRHLQVGESPRVGRGRARRPGRESLCVGGGRPGSPLPPPSAAAR